MAESIEAAWEELRKMTLPPRVKHERIEDAARALALAVAKEIFREHHPRLCGIWAAAYNDMLIESIEALGT